ncbi:MAG: FUSC family protein [Bdellovibrio sp.]|nr:FUSC family protein [Bdellovibrio sp.]
MTTMSASKSATFWSPLFTFDRTKIDFWVALRSAVGVGLAMGIGFYFESPALGLSIALGSLNVCLTDNSDSYAARARRMMRATLVTMLIVFLSAISANNVYLAVTLVTMLAFISGYSVVLDTVTADLGVMAIATFVVFGAQALEPSQAFHLSLYAMGGGLLQAALALVLWPLRRYRPERRALASLYDDLAKLCLAPTHSSEVPAGSVQSIETQNRLSFIAGDSRPEGRRFRSLLSQAERLRLSVLSLARLKNRIERENAGDDSVRIISEFLQKEARLVTNVAEVIRAEESTKVARAFLHELDLLTQQIRSRDVSKDSKFMLAVFGDVLRQMEGAVGQSRAVVELSERTTSEGMAASDRREHSRPWRFKFRGVMATFRANFTFESAGFRHAVRLAVCVAIGELVSHMISVQRSYWVPMTVAIVLKPDYASTFNRGFLRMGGTILGLLFATALFHFLPLNPLTEITLMVIFTFMLRWIGAANYGIFGICISAVVVVLVAMTGVAPKDVIWARGINTVIGGILALGTYMLWPTWEKTQLSEVVAKMLDCYRHLFHAVGYLSLREGSFSALEMDQLRQRSRLGRSDFNASMSRYLLERGSTSEDREFLAAITAASNRMAHAMVALESGSPMLLPPEQMHAYKQFVDKVDQTLDLLSESLRGRDVRNNEFPDLRAAYVELEMVKAADQDIYGLLFAETDRMTNSLNTLKEYIQKRLISNRKASSASVESHQT